MVLKIALSFVLILLSITHLNAQSVVLSGIQCGLEPPQPVDAVQPPVNPDAWRLTNPFGNILTNRDIVLPTGYWQHTGEDWLLNGSGRDSAGQDIRAVANGIVVYAGDPDPTKRRGQLVVIKHKAPPGREYPLPGGQRHYVYSDGFSVDINLPSGNTDTFYSYYLHLGTIATGISPGTSVSKNELLGNLYSYEAFLAETYVYKPHVHFEIWKTCSAIERNGYDKAGEEFQGAVNDLLVPPSDFISAVGSSEAPPDKSLARIENQPEVYWLQNEKAYHVLGQGKEEEGLVQIDLIQAMSILPGSGWGWDKINVYPSDVLLIEPILPVSGSFKRGPDFITDDPRSDGLLIREANTDEIFLVKNGERRHISSPEVFQDVGFNWNDVIEVTEQILNLMPTITILVANFVNGNTDMFASRVYLFNPSQRAGDMTVRVFTLPLIGGLTQELTGTPLNLGNLGTESAVNIKLAEDILTPLGITVPYKDDGGNLTLEFTIDAAGVSGTAQVFDNSLTLAFGTYPLQEILSTSGQGPTILVANFMNGNNGFVNSRVYLWNSSASAGDITVRVFTLPLIGGLTQELTGTPLNLGTLGPKSAVNIKLAEDILYPLGMPLPYTDDGGNITLEFTIEAPNVRGVAQVFSSSFAFGTYPLQETSPFNAAKASSTPTLSVSLSASPSSGNAPLNRVDLTATVSGSATGTINYTFYCNRLDSGTNITSGWAAKFDGINDNPKTAVKVCDYSSAGTYTAKVIAERGNALPAEARTTITVSTASTPTLRIDGGTSSTRQRNGGTFSFTGSSYTLNNTVTRRIRQTDNSEIILTPAISADGSGNISWTFSPTCSTHTGTYTLWVVDDATGRTSNTVAETVTSNPICEQPTQISSLSPSTVVGSTFDLTINGSNFDSGAVDQIYKPDGSLLGSGTIKSRSSIRIVVTEQMAGAAPGNYTVRVKNSDDKLSDAKTLTLISQVSISPSSGTAGTTFSYQGKGFTGSHGVTSHLKKPDGTEFPTLQISTNSQGEFSHSINSTGFEAGTYQAWAVDNNTGISSNTVSFEVLQEEIGFTISTISGKVTLSDETGLADIRMFLFRPGDTVLIRYTDASGFYLFSVLNGTWLIRPDIPGYDYDPPERTVTVVGADVTGVDFVATPNAGLIISGKVTLPNNSGLPNIRVLLFRPGDTVLIRWTDASGSYSFTINNGTWEIKPDTSGYDYDPPIRTVTVAGANVTGVNFVATPK